VAVPADIRDEGDLPTAVGAVGGELGGLDILVNNAAKQHAVEHIEDLTSEQFDAHTRRSYGALVVEGGPAHLPPGGAIINTASVEAYAPEPQLLDYASTKAAIVASPRRWPSRSPSAGVRVNAVAPGPYLTPLQVTGGGFRIRW